MVGEATFDRFVTRRHSRRVLAELRSIISPMGPRQVVVLTDRYPPDAHGGAELSLHTSLRDCSWSNGILVVTTRDCLTPFTYVHEGIAVLVVPSQGSWPFHRLPKIAATRVEALGLDRVVGSRYSRTTGEASPTGGFSHEPLSVPEGLSAQLVRDICKACRAQLIHADNYRSVSIAAAAIQGTDLRGVGLVRDNRFHCVRHSQSVIVGGRQCETCSLACVDEDAKSPQTRQELRDNLVQLQQFRASSLRAMSAVVVTSEYLEKSVRPLLGERQLYRVPNSPDPLSRAASSLRGRAEMVGTNLIVVGMLNENKGQVALLRSLPSLVERIPDVRLHFVGRGDRIARRISEISQELGVADRVEMHGYLDRDHLYALYRRCQIVVLPTVWPEPFGRVPLEAGLARRPCVSFAVGGLIESIVDGRTGLLIPPGDMRAMTDAIVRLAREPGLRRKMGEAAFDVIQERYDLAHHVDSLPSIWEAVLNQEKES